MDQEKISAEPLRLRLTAESLGSLSEYLLLNVHM